MNVFTNTILIAIAAYVLQLFLPWWIIAVLTFFWFFLFPIGAWKSFFSGFAGIFILWLVYAFLIDHATASVLTIKMLSLFTLPELPMLMVLLTAFTGGLVAGLSAASGYHFSNLLFYRKKY